MGLEVAANFTACRGSAREIEPVARRVGRATGDNIDNFPTFQFIIQRHHARHQAIAFGIAVGDLSNYTRSCAPVPHL